MATTVIRRQLRCPERDEHEAARLIRDADDRAYETEPGCIYESRRLRRIAEALTQQ